MGVPGRRVLARRRGLLAHRTRINRTGFRRDAPRRGGTGSTPCHSFRRGGIGSVPQAPSELWPTVPVVRGRLAPESRPQRSRTENDATSLQPNERSRQVAPRSCHRDRLCGLGAVLARKHRGRQGPTSVARVGLLAGWGCRGKGGEPFPGRLGAPGVPARLHHLARPARARRAGSRDLSSATLPPALSTLERAFPTLQVSAPTLEPALCTLERSVATLEARLSTMHARLSTVRARRSTVEAGLGTGATPGPCAGRARGGRAGGVCPRSRGPDASKPRRGNGLRGVAGTRSRLFPRSRHLN